MENSKENVLSDGLLPHSHKHVTIFMHVHNIYIALGYAINTFVL